MKRNNATVLAVACLLALTACGSRRNGNGNGSATGTTQEDMIENGRIGYADLVSFIVQGYQCRWEGMAPEELGLSPVYAYSSELAGFVEKDIDGDSIPELLIGDQFDNGDYRLYDICTIRPEDGSLIHLAKGGERDWYCINGSGILIETASNSAFDSRVRGYRIQKGKLKEVKCWEEDQMRIRLEKFAVLVFRHQLVGAYGQQRDISEEEMAMFRRATDDDGLTVYTPLSVSTQVVAGLNYRFWCRFEELGEAGEPSGEKQEDRSGYCWITVYKPLPGQGEPRVTAIVKDNTQTLRPSRD